MNSLKDDYVEVVQKTVFVKDAGNGHWKKRITVKRRYPKIRIKKKERIKNAGKGVSDLRRGYENTKI